MRDAGTAFLRLCRVGCWCAVAGVDGEDEFQCSSNAIRPQRNQGKCSQEGLPEPCGQDIWFDERVECMNERPCVCTVGLSAPLPPREHYVVESHLVMTSSYSFARSSRESDSRDESNAFLAASTIVSIVFGCDTPCARSVENPDDSAIWTRVTAFEI